MNSNDLQSPLRTSDRHNYYNTYSIQSYNNENEPTDRRRNLPIQEKAFLVLLFLILLVGMMIGLYLIATEGHQRIAPVVYNVTSRELWKAHDPSSTISKLKLPAKKVLFLPTNTSTCDSKFRCAKLVLELQLKHMMHLKEPAIVYNFIMSKDGNIFEGRGWNFETSVITNPTNKGSTISVAFLGEYDDMKAPTYRQTESARFFVETAITERKLEDCFKIMVLGHNVFFAEMASNIQDTLSDCKET